MINKNEVTATYAQGLRMALPDAYDAAELTLGQLLQLIEQTAPYTDFLMVKGEIDDHDKIALLGRGFYVRLITNTNAGEPLPWRTHELDKDYYTLIRWTEHTHIK